MSGRKRATERLYSAEDQALDQISKEAEERIQARRQARAEAREIRLREIERQQKEEEDKQKGYPDAPKSFSSYSGSRRGSNDSTESDMSSKDSRDPKDKVRELKNQLRELEDKYKQAMVTNAQLDNTKTSHVFQLELLKEQLEEREEGMIEVNREYKDKCRDYDLLKRDFDSLTRDCNGLKQMMELKDKLLQDSGLVIVSSEEGELSLTKCSDMLNSPVPMESSLIVSEEAAEILKKTAGRSLGKPNVSVDTSNSKAPDVDVVGKPAENVVIAAPVVETVPEVESKEKTGDSIPELESTGESAPEVESIVSTGDSAPEVVSKENTGGSAPEGDSISEVESIKNTGNSAPEIKSKENTGDTTAEAKSSVDEFVTDTNREIEANVAGTENVKKDLNDINANVEKVSVTGAETAEEISGDNVENVEKPEVVVAVDEHLDEKEIGSDSGVGNDKVEDGKIEVLYIRPELKQLFLKEGLYEQGRGNIVSSASFISMESDVTYSELENPAMADVDRDLMWQRRDSSLSRKDEFDEVFSSVPLGTSFTVEGVNSDQNLKGFAREYVKDIIAKSVDKVYKESFEDSVVVRQQSVTAENIDIRILKRHFSEDLLETVTPFVSQNVKRGSVDILTPLTAVESPTSEDSLKFFSFKVDTEPDVVLTSVGEEVEHIQENSIVSESSVSGYGICLVGDKVGLEGEESPEFSPPVLDKIERGKRFGIGDPEFISMSISLDDDTEDIAGEQHETIRVLDSSKNQDSGTSDAVQDITNDDIFSLKEDIVEESGTHGQSGRQNETVKVLDSHKNQDSEKSDTVQDITDEDIQPLKQDIVEEESITREQSAPPETEREAKDPDSGTKNWNVELDNSYYEDAVGEVHEIGDKPIVQNTEAVVSETKKEEQLKRSVQEEHVEGVENERNIDIKTTDTVEENEITDLKTSENTAEIKVTEGEETEKENDTTRELETDVSARSETASGGVDSDPPSVDDVSGASNEAGEVTGGATEEINRKKSKKKDSNKSRRESKAEKKRDSKEEKKRDSKIPKEEQKRDSKDEKKKKKDSKDEKKEGDENCSIS